VASALLRDANVASDDVGRVYQKMLVSDSAVPLERLHGMWQAIVVYSDGPDGFSPAGSVRIVEPRRIALGSYERRSLMPPESAAGRRSLWEAMRWEVGRGSYVPDWLLTAIANSQWTQAERQELAATWLHNSGYTPQSAEILGRTDDGLEPVMRAKLIEIWNRDRRLLDHLAACLVDRNDIDTLPILQAIRTDAMAGGPCGEDSCEVLVRVVSDWIWKLELLSSPSQSLLDQLAGPLASEAAEFARGDRRRGIIAKELLRRGVSPKDILVQFDVFASKLTGQGPRNSEWSRAPSTLGPLRRTLVRLRIIEANAVWPNRSKQ
jgi:hypothetical protein